MVKIATDLTGLTFGYWTVIERRWRAGSRDVYWFCRCKCGTERVVHGGSLRGIQSISCGCFKLERTSTHRASKSAEFRAYQGMKQRCYNPKSDSFANYGARGIRVFSEWLGTRGFETFLAYIGLRPSAMHSLDRYPDRDGDYEPGNLRWATKSEQSINRDAVPRYACNGRTLSLIEWSREPGVSLTVNGLRWRMSRTDLTMEERIFGKKGLKKIDRTPDHGTISRYTNQRCRCNLCKEAWRDDSAKRRADPAQHARTMQYRRAWRKKNLKRLSEAHRRYCERKKSLQK